MNKFIPKGYVGWIWTIGVLTTIALVIYTLVTDTSPFEAWGLDRQTTTIVFGALVGVLILLPMVFRKKN